MRFTHRLKTSLRVLFSGAIPLLFLSAFFVTPAFATATVTAVTSTAISNQGILPNSPSTALLRVQVTFASGDTLTDMYAAVFNYDGLSSGEISELAIHTDSNNNGVFDSGDNRIAYKTDPIIGVSYGTYNSGPNPWDWYNFTSESHYGAPSNIWYYFIVVKTSDSIDNTNAFYGRFIGIYGNTGNNNGTFSGTNSNVVRCECKVVDIFYTDSYEDYLLPYNLVAEEYETYWKLNYLSYAISQEMTEPNETNPVGTHLYYLSQARRYSYLSGSIPPDDYLATYSNFLKFERRRKLLGMNVPTPVLGIKVAGKNQWQSTGSGYYDNDYFDTMVVTFRDTHRPDTANFDPETMLFAIQPFYETSSGVAVYQDTNNNDVFDEGDTALNIDSSSWSAWSGDQKTLTLHFSSQSSNPQAVIPQVFDADLYNYDWQDRHDKTGVDFFVVLRARPLDAQDPVKINYGADFTVQVTSMDFRGGDNMPPASSVWYETREIKAVFELSDYTGTRVDPDSTFPVIGINVNDGGLFETLDHFNFYLKKTGTNFDPAIDLAASGVRVLNRSGVVVPTTLSVWSTVAYQGEDWWAATITFNPAASIPNNDVSENAGPDYFVALTTSDDFGYDKKIVARIPDHGFIFGSGVTSAVGTALITNANVDHGSNGRVYPDIDPSAPVFNPILGNPYVNFSQINSSVNINSDPTAIIGIDLAANTTVDTPALKSMVVQIVDTTGAGFAPSDLAGMDIDSAVSGIGLYLDNGDGIFNANVDAPLPLSFKPSTYFSDPTEDYRRYLLVLQDPLILPDGTGGDSDRIFVTLKTSRTITSADAVIMRVWGSEIKPASSYGLGFRARDDGLTSIEASSYGVTVNDQDTLTLGAALGGVSGDYNNNWYLVITDDGADAIGRVYKVTGVTDPAGTPVVTVEGIDLTTIGAVSAVKFFKVDSTSYKNFSALIACSGVFNVHLDIIEPGSAGETPIATPAGPQYTIEYDADAPAGTPLALYRVTDPTYTDTTLIAGGLSVGFGQTYVWNTNTVPPGTYYIYGILGSGGNTDTAYSIGTVTITNSSPTAGTLAILPAPVNNSGSITLYDIADGDSNLLTVIFYSTDDTGEDTIYLPAEPVSPPYPTDLTVLWDTTLVPAGDRFLYAIVSDGINPDLLIGPELFTIDHPPSITLIEPNTPEEPAYNRHYLIQWIAGGLDTGTETVDLYRVTDPTYTDTTLIASGLDATDGSWDWDTFTPTDVPDGIYRIYGIITDGTYTDSAYSLGTVEVMNDLLSPDTTIHVVLPNADICLDGVTDVILYPGPVVIGRGQALAPFHAADNIRWYDTWASDVWDPTKDGLWLDSDGDGLYNGLPNDTLLAGVAPLLGTSGVLLTSLNPFAYWDVSLNAQWNLGEAIVYEEGEGNRRLYYSDPIVTITWDTTPPGGVAGADTLLKIYLEKGGVYEEVYSDTVYVGESLAGSFDYDFSQLAISQHGQYHVILRVIDPSGWYLPVDHYALVGASLIPAVITVNSAPNLVITRPEIDTDIWPGYPYNITYIATDPDSDAVFGLYAYDAATADTYPIVGPLTEADGPGEYLWNAALDASIPRNVYLNIEGVISDGICPDSTLARATGRVRILDAAPSVILEADSTDTVIILTWTDSTPPGEAKTYTIWRMDVTAADSPLVMIEGPDENNPPEPVLIDPATNTWQYIDNDLTLQKCHTYYYYIQVDVTEGGSEYVFYSNTVSAMLTAFQHRPTDLEIVPGRLMADLSWNWTDGNVILEDGFIIERRVRGATTFTVIGTVAGNDVTFGLYTDSAYTDSMLRQQGNFWQYRVRAFKICANGNVGYSRYSDIIETEIMRSLDTTDIGTGSGAGSCFIATAAFGTPMAKEVVILRKFRDKFLMTRNWGRAFVRFYYRHSPQVAEYIRPRPFYCSLVRSMLRPLIWLVKAVL